jgi:hypothetical protein
MSQDREPATSSQASPPAPIIVTRVVNTTVTGDPPNASPTQATSPPSNLPPLPRIGSPRPEPGNSSAEGPPGRSTRSRNSVGSESGLLPHHPTRAEPHFYPSTRRRSSFADRGPYDHDAFPSQGQGQTQGVNSSPPLPPLPPSAEVRREERVASLNRPASSAVGWIVPEKVGMCHLVNLFILGAL